MRPGLTVKLSLLFACIGILASGATGYYAYSTNQRLLVGEAERNLLSSTQLLSQRFSSSLDDIAVDAQTLARLPLSASVAASQQGELVGTPAGESLVQLFASMIRAHPLYSQVRLITRQHHGLELIRFDRDGERQVRVMGAQLQEKGHFPYVFEALSLAPEHIYISPITVNHEQGAHSAEGAPTLRVSAPIVTQDGTVVGVVVINVDLKQLLQYVQVDLPAQRQLYLTNESGDFLAHPDPAMTFGFDKGRRFLIQDSFPETKALFNKTRSSVLVHGLNDPLQPKGQILAFVRKPFGLSESHQFIVLGLMRPLEDVLQGGRSLGYSIIQMVLAFSLLAVVLAIVFSRALTRPLQMLTHAVTSFQTGHMYEELPVRRKDEIGVLARCFDQMRKELTSHLEMMNQNQQELAHLAHHDSLTGLPNRMQFFRLMERSIAESVRENEQLAVLFIDLDHFKQINDQMGHAVGDQVLIVVAQRLRGALRDADVVARLGGDEFIVLIKGEAVAALVPSIAEKILNSLSDELVIHGVRLQIGASIGVSLFPDDGMTVEELVLCADSAMYRAKVSGRYTFLRYQGAE